MSIATADRTGPRLWVPGDWNGFFGLFTNIALNVIVLTGLCLGVVKMPAGIVFGRVLPALGIALPIGNLFYAWLAYQLAHKDGRSDVTALPYGPSVPHMFIVVFLVMLPTYLKTKDPVLAWQAGLVWPSRVPGAVGPCHMPRLVLADGDAPPHPSVLQAGWRAAADGCCRARSSWAAGSLSGGNDRDEQV